ncbi:MAG: sugar phosphorylase [Desulfosudaceae bacterium]
MPDDKEAQTDERNLARIKSILELIYGPARGREALARIKSLLDGFPVQASRRESFVSQDDVVLITYGNSLNRPGQKPLATLGDFARQHLADLFAAIHILPFFPYSSDDGFSVIDFKAVNPELGSWDDINRLSRDFDLMVDLVLNHISARSDWFCRYLHGEDGFKELALEVDPSLDLDHVVRPRVTPLLTAFTRADGKTVHVWTTFSADQIDLNYKSLDVLEKMLDVLLFYVRQGAALIRLDAIAYLWKETETTCIHCVQTHEMVRLFRAVLDRVAPDTVIITETNVPHSENISYFGNGRDEAQMVYNFTLPPLLLHTFVKGEATALARWAKDLEIPAAGTTYFNFTASHDGIGVRPLEGVLPAEEIARLVRWTRAKGGDVSCKKNSDGSETPYELNITYVDAIGGAGDGAAGRAAAFLASQAIQLVFPGVPGVYIHSLLGSRNWTEGVRQTGRARTINREPLELDRVLAELARPGSPRQAIFTGYADLLRIRRRQPAFHPRAAFTVEDFPPAVFGVTRTADRQTILALTNVTGREIALARPEGAGSLSYDLISGDFLKAGDIHLKPFQSRWLTDNPF